MGPTVLCLWVTLLIRQVIYMCIYLCLSFSCSSNFSKWLQWLPVLFHHLPLALQLDVPPLPQYLGLLQYVYIHGCICQSISYSGFAEHLMFLHVMVVIHKEHLNYHPCLVCYHFLSTVLAHPQHTVMLLENHKVCYLQCLVGCENIYSAAYWMVFYQF